MDRLSYVVDYTFAFLLSFMYNNMPQCTQQESLYNICYSCSVMYVPDYQFILTTTDSRVVAAVGLFFMNEKAY